MPIGGLREKILAAKRAGINQVMVPAENQDSIEELPDYIKSGMKIEFVKNVDEILKKMLID